MICIFVQGARWKGEGLWDFGDGLMEMGWVEV